MTELDLYTKLMQMCKAHTHTSEWRKVNCFAVGYLSDLNADNLEQSTFRKDYFYSEKWMQEGKNPNAPVLDWPLCLLLPPEVESEIDREGRHTGVRTFKMIFYVLDLLGYDRNNTKDTAYANRGREQIWNDTLSIAEELLIEFNKTGFKAQPKHYLSNNGKYDAKTVLDIQNQRLAGIQIQCSCILHAGCPAGTFNYSKTFPQQEEKYNP